MAQAPELKTSLKQRIGIIIVAVILLGSTVALYMGIVLNYSDGNSSATANSEKEQRFNELYSQYQTEVDAQAKEYSDIHFDTFAQYKSKVKAYNAAAITEVTHTDLKVGDGEEVTEGFDNYSAYYIGWLSDETVFDTSFDSFETPTALKSPLPGGQMIEGWNVGIIGMKIGGVREISIPSELAYGDQEQGNIPANSPLKFIVMLIPKAPEIDWPEEMYELYYELYGGTQ
jgi:FKBP-type peptidyl-prolyl cis-trans isomerase